MKIKHEANYARLRAKAYPPLADLADALVKQAQGDPKPFQDYVAACAAVKARFPKPAVAPSPQTPPTPPGKP